MTVLSPTAGTIEALAIDPLGEDPANTLLTLISPGTGIDVISQEYPAPDRDRLTASGADVVGAPVVQSQYRNRTITLKVRCFGSHATMRARLAELTMKVGKLARYGGTLQRTLANGDPIVFDILDADLDVPADFYMAVRNSAICTLTLLCKPFGRGSDSTYGAATETTNPELVFTVAAPAGDVPALGLLEITEGSGVDQWWLQWGLESHRAPGTATASTTAALAFSGVTRLAYNGATALAVTGAVGGTVLNQGNLTTSYGALCSLASSGTVYPTHVGTFGVWARLYMGTGNAGTVTAALEWSQADLLNYTRNDGTVLESTRKGAYLHTYLGQVRLDKVTTGAQRWDGRVVARSSTVGDDLAVDRLYLFPVLDGYGEASGVQRFPAPTTFLARDEFAQAAGALVGETLPTGGTWAGVGDADDFQNTGSAVTRATATDSADRVNYASTDYSDIAVQADVKVASVGSNSVYMGVVCRFVDSSNYLYAYVEPNSTPYPSIQIYTKVAGAFTRLAYAFIAPLADDTYYRVRVAAYASGRWALYGGPPGTDLVILAAGYAAALATGGALATGRVGLRDYNASAGTPTRTYDNFAAWAPPADAALYASKTLSIYHDHVGRQDSSGTAEARPSDYRGDYLTIPPAQFGGTARMIVKACRTYPHTGVDSGIDDISATLRVTPRYLHIPE